MCTDKFSIGRLIKVHVSSIVNEAIKTISSQFFFFYEKILSVQKAPKPNHPLRSFCAHKKTVAFIDFCSLIFAFVGWFWLICVFVRSKSFFKKNKLALNCLDSLIYYTTTNKCKDFDIVNIFVNEKP